MTPQQQREKVLRDTLKEIATTPCQRVKPGTAPLCPSCRAIGAIAAADAIPDAPVEPTWKTKPRPTIAELEAILASNDAPRLEILPNGEIRAVVDQTASKPVPSRAELIELMMTSWHERLTYDSEAMARVLDALIKAGAVR